ncbi:MAG: DUF4199 domain-containing protein, partial [Bacteroidota bacterium]|nr:DUF4199 domain-containing protein [Bacteroidota bacterium]
LLAYLDKGLIDQLKTIQEETLLSKGYSPDMVQQQMDMASRFMTPGFIAVTSIITSTFMGFILSLITSIFTHKSNPDPFIGAMAEIEKEEQPSSSNIEEPKSVEEASVEEPSKDKKEE